MTDFVDGSGLWQIGYDSGPIPPAPTPTVDDGDGVTIPGLPPGMMVSTTAYRRRSRLDDIANPWVAILRWLRKIDATREWTADYWRQIELDDMDIIELSQISARGRKR